MYIGWREIRRSAGKFGLMVGVIALLAFLVVMLSALTAGLGWQSSSAVQRLPGVGLIVQRDAGGTPVNLVDSRLDETVVAQVGEADPQARPLGIAMAGLSARHLDAAVALVGREGAAPGVTINAATASTLGVRVGDPVSVGGVSTTVTAIADTAMFAHAQVAEVPIAVWRVAAHRAEPSAMILTREVGPISGASTAIGGSRLNLIPGYASEHGSLLLIQGLLVVIAAVVVGAFFAVWTSQRLVGLAVVRAMGAGRGYLLADGLGQVAAILAVGLVLGTAAGGGLAGAVAGVVPISLTASGVALPVTIMAVLGLVGALLALRPLTSVDPLTALNR